MMMPHVRYVNLLLPAILIASVIAAKAEGTVDTTANRRIARPLNVKVELNDFHGDESEHVNREAPTTTRSRVKDKESQMQLYEQRNGAVTFPKMSALEQRHQLDLAPLDIEPPSRRKITVDQFFGEIFADKDEAGEASVHSKSIESKPPGVPAIAQEDKLTIVRMTGFREDPQITTTINRDAVTMALKLLSTKKTKVAILMERNGVFMAGTGYSGMYCEGNEIDFHKMLKEFLSGGGRIIVNKHWSDLLMVQPKDCLEGTEFMDEAALASLLVDASRVVDYAAPTYPFNMMVRNGSGSVLPAVPASTLHSH